MSSEKKDILGTTDHQIENEEFEVEELQDQNLEDVAGGSIGLDDGVPAVPGSGCGCGCGCDGTGIE